MKINKSERIILVLLITIALFFRFSFVKGNSFHFYFDQARDAHISRGILERGDFKIQGPSASGTDETVYHGVLYYYLIGPIYTLFTGNPIGVVLFLGILNSLTIIPIYLVSRELTTSKATGFLASFLYAFSLDATQISMTLYNASLGIFSIPWLFYFLFLVFVKKKDKYLPWLAFSLGITLQSAVFLAYLTLIALFMYFYRANQTQKVFLFKNNLLLKSLVIYFLTISSMLLAQFKLFRAGIFNPLKAFIRVQHDIDLVTTVSSIFRLYLEKISSSIFPSLPTLSFFVFIFCLIWFITSNQYRNHKFFLWVWLFTPLFLYSFAFRDHYHTMLGILAAIYIIVSLALTKLAKTKIGLIAALGFLMLFINSNVSGLKTIRAQEFDKISVQRGAFLKTQLRLIDHTYKISNGNDFSISSLTAPHGWNTTWSYLFDWYGKKTYGYVPSWFGPTQIGIPAGELLKRVEKPLDLHFTIYEPDPGSLDVHRAVFELEQNIFAGSPSATMNFGRIILEQR